MSLLDEYQKLMNTEPDNEFPEEMQNEGLSEGDREVYKEVLNKMRADMDRANEDMRKNSLSWGNICDEVGGSIQNRTFKMNEEMLNKMPKAQPYNQVSNGVAMYQVSEPISFFVDGFRCPHCRRLMYEENGMFVCPACGYKEEAKSHMQFSFLDSKYNKIPLSRKDNEFMCDMFLRANNTTR